MPKSRTASQRPAAAASPSPAPGEARECRRCRQWSLAPADTYCGFCGRLLLDLELRPAALLLISGIAPAKELVLANTGAEPVRAVLVPAAAALPGLTIEPAGPIEVPPQSEVRLLVRLDAASLPADLRERKVPYVCVVDDDRRKALPVVITVRTGPRPHLVTPAVEFGELREGTVAQKSLVLRNLGGTPLRVREVQPLGSSRLRLAEKPAFPLRVDPGKEIALAVAWDGRAAETAPDPSAARLRIAFDNHPEVLHVPARARLYQYALQLAPPHLHSADALSKQDLVERVVLENRGGVDVVIAGIEADQPWIQVVAPAEKFTLLCRGSADAAAPTAFREAFPFQVVCHPQKLTAGWHTGRVVVRPVGQEAIAFEVKANVVRPQPSSDYVGIDFGTTNSVVAVIDESSNSVELVEDGPEDQRSPLIPSVLAFLGGPDVHRIGQMAKNEANAAPDRVVRSIKRLMGYDHDWEFFGRKFSPEQLASLIIRKLVELAETRLYERTGTYYDLKKAILTVPANFFDLQIRGVLEAAALAGLDTEEEQVRQAAQAMRDAFGQEVNAGVILDEPSAAALYYLHHLEEQGRASELLGALGEKGAINLLVFDYGGGTLDVSIANVERLPQGAVGLRVLANMGNNRIGGDSIDLLLRDELVRRCLALKRDFEGSLVTAGFKDLAARREQESWSDAVWSRVLGVRSHWKDLAERTKIALSESASAAVEIPPELIVRLAGGEVRSAAEGLATTLERSDFEALLEGTLRECEALIHSALDLARLAPGAVDYVLHTGRQSLLPAVRGRVRRALPELPPGRDLLEPEHLKVCVAKGAALYGLMRGRLADPTSGVHFLNEGRRLPHSYGVEKLTGLMRREFDEIIPRGATYPTRAERHYGPEMLRGSTLALKFYQNRSGRKTMVQNPGMSLIGQVTVDVRAAKQPGCDVRFLIDANRKLEVYANGTEVEIIAARIKDEESWVG